MKLINEFENLNSKGEIEIWVKIERAENEFSWMPKADWDNLEAEREQSGTL